MVTDNLSMQHSGVAKAGPGRARARPKFDVYMCARALVLLAQWLGVQQVPDQYQWPGYATDAAANWEATEK